MIKFKLRTVAMETVVSQHVRHLGHHLGVFKNCSFSKIAANLLELSRKHMFRNIITHNVEKKLEQILSKNYIF